MTVDGRLFHALAAATRNARSPSDDLLAAGTTSAGELDDLRRCLGSMTHPSVPRGGLTPSGVLFYTYMYVHKIKAYKPVGDDVAANTLIVCESACIAIGAI